jgi:hypothetical protein
VKEYYPSPFRILSDLGMECVLVGSASRADIFRCKDVDFVVSDKGLRILSAYDYWLDTLDTNWKVWIPFEETGFQKGIDFFHGKCDIEDKSKYHNRITYDEAILLPLKVVVVDYVEVLSI